MENSIDRSKMVYRYLGNTGLKVSLFSFGTMLTEYTEDSIKTWTECADHAYKNGINFFDSSEAYGFGEGDKMLGNAIKQLNWRREDIVVSVKVYFGGKVNTLGLSRKKIIETTKKCLKNMDLDYCDIVFAHRDDPETPLEETCRAFNWLINKGYALYWATSTWPEETIVDAIRICDKNGWHRPIADQCEYSCLTRQYVEDKYRRLFEKFGYGTTIWSPLSGGFLTGKYNDGVAPEGSRYDKSEAFKAIAWDRFFGEKTKDKTISILKGLKELADEKNVTQAQLALAWTLVNKDVSSCIIGASRLSQLESNLKALEIAAGWTSEFEEKINKVLGNDAAPLMNWLHFAPFPSRRGAVLDTDMELGKIQYRDPDFTAKE